MTITELRDWHTAQKEAHEAKAEAHRQAIAVLTAPTPEPNAGLAQPLVNYDWHWFPIVGWYNMNPHYKGLRNIKELIQALSAI